jgi:hypothetical protein
MKLHQAEPGVLKQFSGKLLKYQGRIATAPSIAGKIFHGCHNVDEQLVPEAISSE